VIKLFLYRNFLLDKTDFFVNNVKLRLSEKMSLKVHGKLDVGIRPPEIAFGPIKGSWKHECFDIATGNLFLTAEQIAGFLISLPRDFLCKRMHSYRTKLYVLEMGIKDKTGTDILRINMTEQHLFRITIIQNEPAIRKIQVSEKSCHRYIINEAAYYVDAGEGENFAVSKSKIPAEHPFCILGKHLCNTYPDKITFQALFEKECYSSRTVSRHHTSTVAFDTESEIDKLDGPVFITFNDKMKTKFIYHEHIISTLTYIIPWLEQLINRADYIQLDGSFYAASPYAYTVPQIVINNDAYPIGFTICPTETADMFIRFYSNIHRVYGDDTYIKLLHLSVLSDEGAGIKKFCTEKGIRQFFCYSYLINKFGAGTNLGILVSKMLFTQSREEYDRDHTTNFTLAAMIFEEEPKHLIAFQELFGEILDRTASPDLCPWTKINDNYEEQAF
jgi:hypothetical protein